MLPPRTYEVQAGYGLGLIEIGAVVTWAIDALAAGYNSKSLRMLAGLEPPHDSEEVGRLYSAVFTEIGIRSLPADKQVQFYITSVLRAMEDGKFDRKKALERLSDLHIARGYDCQLTDFYLLYHAKWDLESEKIQWYWKGADRSNIDQIIDDHAKHWLESHASEETGNHVQTLN